MASSQVVGLLVLVCLSAFSGSAVGSLQGWFFWPFPAFPGFPGFPGTQPQPEDSCQDVNNYYTSCKNFVVGGSQYPPQECCSGLNHLNQVSKNDANGPRRICRCIEAVAARTAHPPYSQNRINDLYSYCNVHLNFPISEHMDCDRI